MKRRNGEDVTAEQRNHFADKLLTAYATLHAVEHRQATALDLVYHGTAMPSSTAPDHTPPDAVQHGADEATMAMVEMMYKYG